MCVTKRLVQNETFPIPEVVSEIIRTMSRMSLNNELLQVNEMTNRFV